MNLADIKPGVEYVYTEYKGSRVREWVKAIAIEAVEVKHRGVYPGYSPVTTRKVRMVRVEWSQDTIDRRAEAEAAKAKGVSVKPLPTHVPARTLLCTWAEHQAVLDHRNAQMEAGDQAKKRMETLAKAIREALGLPDGGEMSIGANTFYVMHATPRRDGLFLSAEAVERLVKQLGVTA